MIFVLICCSYSDNVFDFKEIGFVPNSLSFHLYSLETIIIKIRNLKAFFSEWKNYPNLYLELETERSNSDIISYGPFNSGNNLYGISFKENCTLIFYNRGIDLVKFEVNFDSFYKSDDYYDELKIIDGFIYKEKSNTGIVLYATIGGLSLFYLAINVIFCCCF